MGLVNHQVGPLHSLEEVALLADDLVACEEDIEGQLPARVLQLKLADDLPGAGAPGVGDGVEVRGPDGELGLPGGQGGQRHHHQHRALERVGVDEILEEGDGLDSLAETLEQRILP